MRLNRSKTDHNFEKLTSQQNGYNLQKNTQFDASWSQQVYTSVSNICRPHFETLYLNILYVCYVYAPM